MVSKCAKLLLPVLAHAFADDAKSLNVMVFGDSFGDTGPTYHQVQDMFDTNGVSAEVKSAAVGGTSACHWASQDGGKAMVTKAKSLFPQLTDGPDHVWYTLGGNDIWQDSTFQTCQKKAKTQAALTACLTSVMHKVSACTQTNIGNYLKAFPKSKVMHSGYDVPCNNELCKLTLTGVFDMKYCAGNSTCNNKALYDFVNIYHADLRKAFPETQYTTLLMMGAVQKAAGIAGADVGKPVFDQSANCKWETLCVHPTYNSPAGKAWGQGFWDQYFSKHVNTKSTVV
jgi:hypothetical protein